ncbi:hypothetical protein [Lentzea jiangxiensis]|uniref:Uncharacterized protein n=1 Tax=Lentzea jiangxiensis TaxID=641025 RepID=A0A1H0ML16_9PSEU|nr:hypothetical protein [Lentzea jiangxiensis]SDO81034.1 hypothetical protein SAMN05421507_10431 [Lentzea jiangxiensis]
MTVSALTRLRLVQIGLEHGTNLPNGVVYTPPCGCKIAHRRDSMSWAMGVTVLVGGQRMIVENSAIEVALHLADVDLSTRPSGAVLAAALLDVVDRFGVEHLAQLGKRHYANDLAVTSGEITAAQWRKTTKELFGSARRADKLIFPKVRVLDYVRDALNAACASHMEIPVQRRAVSARRVPVAA